MNPHDVAELAQTLFEEIGDAAFIADPVALCVLDANPMAERLTNRPRSELLKTPLDQLFRSRNDEGLRLLQRALETTNTFHSQEGYLLRRGSSDHWTPVNLTITRLHAEDGPLGLLLARDITERVRAEDALRRAKAMLERHVEERTAELARVNETLRERIVSYEQATEALRESEELFRAAFEHTAVAMVLTDIDNRFVRVNDSFGRLFGYEPEEMIGMTLADVTHPDDLDDSLANRELLLSGKQRFFQMEKRYLHPDGHIFWGRTNVSLVNDAAGEPMLYVGQVNDITDRKRSQEGLQQAQRRLAHVLASSPAVLFTLKLDGGHFDLCDWISDNISEMLGYQPDQACQPGWWLENVHPDDREAGVAQLEEQLLSAGHSSGEFRFRHASGEFRWLSQELRLIRDPAGNPVEAVGSWFDVTERKKLEDQFRQSQKMEAIGQLAGGVAHDFNNLLTIINGYGTMILDVLKADDPVAEMVREIVAAGERASGLTRQLLTFSRKAVIQPQVFDLRVVVSELDRMLRRIVGEDIILSVASDPTVGMVKADRGQIEQVIMNLIVNARDAMPRGGRITIEVRNVELDESYTRSRVDARPGPYVMLAVSDTGTGMDPATASRVFEPFFTTKGELGTGLGLATVHGIVKQSGGQVTVYSEPDCGTTFKVYLPRIEDAATSASDKTSPVLAGGYETILLVEDEDGVRTLTRRVLEQCGYIVLEASDGIEALEIAAEHDGAIDLLLTDVVLPRMSGRDASERLTKKYPHMKVLFLSGYTDDAVVRHGILQSQFQFLQKPFTPSTLTDKVRQVLDS